MGTCSSGLQSNAFSEKRHKKPARRIPYNSVSQVLDIPLIQPDRDSIRFIDVFGDLPLNGVSCHSRVRRSRFVTCHSLDSHLGPTVRLVFAFCVEIQRRSCCGNSGAMPFELKEAISVNLLDGTSMARTMDIFPSLDVWLGSLFVEQRRAWPMGCGY